MFAVEFLFLGLVSLNLVSAQVSITTASGPFAPRGPFRPGQLIFEENFSELNFEKWQHELTVSGGGNWEFQWYTNERSNSYIDNGTLHIAPTLVTEEFGEDFLSSGEIKIWGGAPADYCTNHDWWGCERRGTPTNFLTPIKSARIRTVNSFAFKYGIVEARVKIPTGDWLWPAVWLMPKHNAYSGWPRSGEIDLLESRGNERLFDAQGRHMGTKHVASTLHYGPYWNQNGYEFANFGFESNTTGFNEDFHVYRVGWTDKSMQFSVDDVVIGTLNLDEIGSFWELGRFDERFNPPRFNPWTRASPMAPFDQEFYLIINLAVGGTNGFFYDGLRNENGNKPWSNDSPTAFRDFWQGRNQWLPSWGLGVDDRSHLQVDYVRVYAVYCHAQVSVTTASGSRAPKGPYRPGQLIFEDNFDVLDHEKWQHESTLGGGGNQEFQWYTNHRMNTYTENGTLHIVPTLFADEAGENFLRSGHLDLHGGEPAGACTNLAFNGCIRTGTNESILNPIKSARLRTVHSFNFKYGTLEIRAKMPTGDW